MDSLKLYLKYIAINLKSELEYKTSFLLTFINQSITFFTNYFVILSLFTKFSSLNEYTVYQILLIFSIIQFGYSMNEVFARGIDHFSHLIIKGDLDRLLTRPRSLILQALGCEIDFTKTTKIIQSVILLIYSLIKLHLNLTPLKVFTLFFMLLASSVIFFNIFLMGAAFCFITTQGLEVVNVFTDGGRDMAQYPMNIYNKYFKFFFTFFIPFSLINYYPFQYLIGKSNYSLFAFLPLLVLLYLLPAIYLFNRGLHKYTSTGS